MLSESEITKAQGSFLMKGVPEEVLSQLLHHSHKRTVGRGETLFLQGDPAHHMYVVLSGCVKLLRLTPGGDEVVLAVYAEGSSFGEAAALKGAHYPVTVEAVQKTTLIQVDARAVLELLRRDPEMVVVMLGSIFAHLHELVMEVENLKALSGAQRLATFLISLAPVDDGACTLVLPYDKILIAKRLGMKPESLSRSFANLRAQGINVSRQSVAISDLARLKAFAANEEENEFMRLPH